MIYVALKRSYKKINPSTYLLVAEDFYVITAITFII